jgi:hypothetical protein
MKKRSRLDELKDSRKEAAEHKRALLKRLQKRAKKSRTKPKQQGELPPAATPLESGSEAESDAISIPPWLGGFSTADPVRLFRRSDAGELYLAQPWTRRLTEKALSAAAGQGVYLCLLWPVAITSVVLIHALATIRRNIAKDLQGQRTLLFPGTYTSATELQAWLVERKQFAELYRSLWSTEGDSTELLSWSGSDSMLAVLAALNSIENEDAQVPSPSLAELFPAFVFEADDDAWSARARSPLERSLIKVAKVRYRKELRARIKPEWADPKAAPGALLVVHNSATKRQWKAALGSLFDGSDSRPDLLLFDATGVSSQRNYGAVRRIPEFLELAREKNSGRNDAIIVTDDPRTFFEFKSRLRHQKIPFRTHCEAAESEYALLSPKPMADDWRPSQKTNSNFSVGIVDRDASAVAVGFARLSHKVGGDQGAGSSSLMAACLYLLRLSNLPAGYRDLTSAGGAGELDDYSARLHEWLSVTTSIQVAIGSGEYGSMQGEAERLLNRGNELVDAWTDATPMAARLQAEVRKHAVDSVGGLIIVLPNGRYIGLASLYFSRTLGDAWASAEELIEWHTLATVSRALDHREKLPHVVFVGVNRNVLRILLAHRNVPNGTTVLIAYRQAESTLKTLGSMKGLDAFKPYRGRIGLLMQELERRLGEFASPVRIDPLRGKSLLFNWDSRDPARGSVDQEYFTFELEDGTRAYSSGWVYRLDPEEDPPFRKTHASRVERGDLIFNMDDSLRSQIEGALQIGFAGQMNSIVRPAKALLKLYHDDIKFRCQTLYSETTRKSLARAIHSRMLELDSGAEECRVERIEYWLDFDENDSRPHASADERFFRLFCGALEIDDETCLNYWRFVKGARQVSQSLGRILAAQYAEVLFHPESAMTYRKIPADVIDRLKQEALQNVSRVEKILEPASSAPNP